MTEKIRKYNREWAKKNPEKRKRSHKKYNEKLKQKRKEKMTQKKVILGAKKYGKMSFSDFWNDYYDKINKDRRLKYQKASKFKRFFLDEENSLLKQSWVQNVAKTFFVLGRLQMTSQLNMELLENKK